MTDREGILSRWSRLKRQAAAQPNKKAAEEAAAPPAAPVVPEPAPDRPDPVAALPPIESLGADSDYTAFLTPGIPQELQRLALRKAWSSDPKITEFRGFAEYDWDYNAPGYGQLLPVDDVKRLCDRVFGTTPADPEAEPPPPAPPAAEETDLAEKPPPDEQSGDNS